MYGDVVDVQKNATHRSLSAIMGQGYTMELWIDIISGTWMEEIPLNILDRVWEEVVFC